MLTNVKDFLKSATAFITQTRGVGVIARPAPSALQSARFDNWNGLEEHRKVEFWNAFGTGNPEVYNQLTFAKQSMSNALGLVYEQDSGFYDYVDEMVGKDTTIAAALFLLCSYVDKRGGDFQVPKERQKDPLAQEIRGRIEGDLCRQDEFDWQQLKGNLLEGTLCHGFSANEIVWEQAPDGKVKVAAYIHRHPSMFDFSPLGKPILRHGRDGGPEYPPPNKLVIMRSRTLYGNPFGRSLVYLLRWLYELKKEAIKAAADCCDTYGVPLGKATIPASAADRAAIEAHMRNVFATLRRRAGVTIPEGVLLEFESRMGGQGKIPHFELVEWCQREEARLLLGAVSHILETQYGNRATSENHSEQSDIKSRELALMRDARVNRQVVTPYLLRNWGERALGAVEWRTHTDDGVDIEAAIKILDLAGKLKVPVGEDTFYDWFNINAPADGDRVIVATLRALATALATAQETEPKSEESGEIEPDEPEFGEGEPEPGLAAFDDVTSLYPEVGAAIRREERCQEIGEHAADLLARDFRKQYGAVLGTWAAGIRQVYVGTDSVVSTMDQQLDPALMDVDLSALATRIVAVSWLVSALSVDGSLGTPVEFADSDGDGADLPPEVQSAAEWMRKRRVMSESEVEAAVARLAKMRGSDPVALEASLRQEALILKDGLSRSLMEQAKRALAAAIEQNLTVEDFVEAMEDAAGGDLSPADEAYWKMVFRTEMAKAYSREQAWVENQEPYRDRLWGWVGWNPVDERSRPTHADFKGVYFQRGGQAARELGRPPFAYNCRCMLVPLLNRAAGDAEWVESPGALTVARGIERW